MTAGLEFAGAMYEPEFGPELWDVEPPWYEELVFWVDCAADALGAASGWTGDTPGDGDRSGLGGPSAAARPAAVAAIMTHASATTPLLDVEPTIRPPHVSS